MYVKGGNAEGFLQTLKINQVWSFNTYTIHLEKYIENAALADSAQLQL